jgi:hypothetical protein
MRLIPLSEEAKKEINFIQNLRKEEMAIHHNYSKADTTYQACEDLYYRNKQDVFLANYGEAISITLVTIILGLVVLRIKNRIGK